MFHVETFKKRLELIVVDKYTSTAFSGIFLQKVQHRSSITLSSANNRYVASPKEKRTVISCHPHTSMCGQFGLLHNTAGTPLLLWGGGTNTSCQWMRPVSDLAIAVVYLPGPASRAQAGRHLHLSDRFYVIRTHLSRFWNIEAKKSWRHLMRWRYLSFEIIFLCSLWFWKDQKLCIEIWNPSTFWHFVNDEQLW